MTKMLGQSQHGPHCDCKFTRYVSGTGYKCNRKHGTKRARGREKRELSAELDSL